MELVASSFAKTKTITATAAKGDWYDFEGRVINQKVAIVVKSHRAQVKSNTIMRTLDRLKRSSFESLFMVSANGYFDTVYDYLENSAISNVVLFTCDENMEKITQVWSANGGRVAPKPKESDGTVDTEPQKPKVKKAKKAKKINIGVFTSKGGVGKSTISAHLAGAMSIIGYETALIDLDPQSNLRKLIGDGGIYIKNKNAAVGNTMNVLTSKEWNEKDYKDIRAVVCDCNPELDKNPVSFVKKFDFCIIPITLNPMGLNKHASVVEQTVKAIRDKNKKVKFLILINQYMQKEGERNKILLDMLYDEVKRMSEVYEDILILKPNKVSIRYSSNLFYWGMHTISNESRSELAFQVTNARSNPKDDFFKLAEYVANYASLNE